METVRQSTSSRDLPLNSQRFVGHRPGEVNPADFPCHGLTAKGEIQREANQRLCIQWLIHHPAIYSTVELTK